MPTSFRASNAILSDAYQQVRIVAMQQKTYLGQWSVALNSNLSALTAMDMVANLNRVIAIFDQISAMPGIVGYAQAQENDGLYDVAAAFSGMRSAHDAIRAWLRSNIPSNAITVTNGVAVGASYTPAQTASLKALVDAAAATIS